MKRLALVAAFSVYTMLVGAASAQNAAGTAEKIAPVGRSAPTVNERTPEQMDAFAASHPLVGSPIVPFRPTMGDAEYRRLKAAANAQPRIARPNLMSPIPLHGITGATAFAGGNANENASVGQPGWAPPDTEGAIGTSQFVQTANNYINVYSKAGVLLSSRSLTSFMGSPANTFDSRVQWDSLWGRWVVTSDTFPLSTTEQLFYWAVSKTASATGAWWVYSWNTNTVTGTGSFWDFPSLGLQQDSMIFTANVFGTSSFLGAYTLALPKAQAYNGQGVYFSVFGGLDATLQPPHVLKQDETGFAWLAAAASGGIKMYRFENPSSPNNNILTGPYTVTGVPAYSAPPSAVQPAPCGGGTNAVDTSDTRFVNASTQYGDLLYQVHSVNVGTATPRYYVISGLSSSAPTVHETGLFWNTSTSSDWNASIAADTSDNLVITYSSVDSAYNAQVRYVGRQHGDAAISGGGVGASLHQSGACLTGDYDPNFGVQRWGDYSAVTLDPMTAKTFWIINEDIIDASTWGNEIGKVHF
jgi:hypothetical protein